MSQLKHWAEYLPEAGKVIEIRTRSIKSMEEEICSLHAQILYLQSQQTTVELELLHLAKTTWTEKEIANAKRVSIGLKKGNY